MYEWRGLSILSCVVTALTLFQSSLNLAIGQASLHWVSMILIPCTLAESVFVLSMWRFGFDKDWKIYGRFRDAICIVSMAPVIPGLMIFAINNEFWTVISGISMFALGVYLWMRLDEVYGFDRGNRRL